ncbi:MAG TPA: helix-turn-helix transcriptional regulator [Gammaproteobacteria bacterium]|nr:helix-turn-helix transcriptional regulator [Gammaproteobacteria bacterium]
MGAASIESGGKSAEQASDERPAENMPRFMSVRQVARYLQVNEKKVYALVADGVIPASKVTGKWLFPRDLVDQWLLESSHGGLLADRMLIAGSDDPVICRAIMHVANEVQARALISYTPTGTQLGLSLLARRRADICGIHWGPAEESHQRHPALLKQHPPHNDWILVRIFLREQGLMVSPSLAGSDPEQLFSRENRWVMRQEGAGSQRFLQEIVTRHGLDPAARRVSSRAYSERDAAAAIAMGYADVGIGVRAAATEFGLDFVPIGWEAFDFAMHRGMFFRTLFQKLLDYLRGTECRRLAQKFGGYDFSQTGNLVWPV